MTQWRRMRPSETGGAGVKVVIFLVIALVVGYFAYTFSPYYTDRLRLQRAVELASA